MQKEVSASLRKPGKSHEIDRRTVVVLGHQVDTAVHAADPVQEAVNHGRPLKTFAVLGHDHGHVHIANHVGPQLAQDRKSTRLNSSHVRISYAVFCLKKKKKQK